MSGRIPREFIDDLLVRVDIVDLIDSHVPLKKSGSNFVARCPFHTEKTPSFSVSRKKQFYHCFGCGAGGTAISFLMEYNHLGFVEAIEDLASFVGVEVPRETANYSASPDKQGFTRLYDALDKVSAFYIEQMKNTVEGKKAIEYLKSRGVSGGLARDFALGYAPDKWDALMSRFDQKLLMDAGMLTKNDAGRVYDRFRGRLMFPIRDKRKRVIGFGGRVLDDSLPKYLNSPETSVFSKGREVYGLCELLEKNSKPKRILIVEGYMDVIALAQFGIDYAVATLGTATSKTQLDLLFRFSSELVFCFDGDAAGQKAAWRAMEAAFSRLSGRRLIKFMVLPANQDPDSLVREQGKVGFSAKVDEAQALSEYFFEHLTSSLNLTSIEGKAKLVAEAKSYLESMPNGFAQDMMLKHFKDKADLVRLEISKNQATIKKPKLTPLRVVIALLLQNPELAEVLEQRNLDWDALSFSGIDLLRDIFQFILVKQPKNAAVVLEAYRDSEQERTVRALANLELSLPDETAEFIGALDHLLSLDGKDDLERLLEKEKRKGLSKQDKDVLRELLAKKCN